MTASERTDGVRAALSLAPIYRFAQNAIGAARFRDTVAEEYLRPLPGDRVLDIGCGTADILDHLPSVDYIGFDPSERYIDDAKQRFGSRGEFISSTAGHVDLSTANRTLAMAIGVFHHLDDDAVGEALRTAHDSLVEGGRFVSIDPTLVAGQHRVAHFLVSRDRGQHVRPPEAIEELLSDVFDDVTIAVRHDMLRVPYSHVIATAAK